MDWIDIRHECLLTKDNYYIVNIDNDIIENDDIIEDCDIYTDSIQKFMKNLQNSYRDIKDLIRQINVDFPRIQCYINGERVYHFYQLIGDLKYTNLLYKVMIICTQVVFYPISTILFNKYTDIENNIHFADYGDKNPMIIKIKIFNKNEMNVTIEKKFRIFKLVDGDPVNLQIILVKIIIDFDEDYSKNLLYHIYYL